MDNLRDLTVYVITIGESTYEECLEALQNQDCTFKIEHVRDVCPMSAAFQAMPDRCQTRYFAQVDADMVLYPHALRALHKAIQGSGFRTYRVHGRLFEEGFGLGGGVKCWKRSIFRLFKFRDARTVDRDFDRRVKRWGFKRQAVEGVMGVHKPRHSSFSLYLKAKSDVEKWRYLGRPVGQYAQGTLDDMLARYPDTRHQVLGALLGALTGKDRLKRSKDIQLERDRYQEVLQLLVQDGDLSNVAGTADSRLERLKVLFGRCYEDMDNLRIEERDQLANETLGLLSKRRTDQTVAQRLLEVVKH